MIKNGKVQMMYPAKVVYQNKEYAAIYEKRRFKGILGKIKNWNTQRLISKLLRLTGREGYALDIPCGTGRLSHLILRNGYRWIGSDISLEMMMESRKKTKGFEDSFWNIRTDAERMPFKDNSVDCILSIRFIYHIPVKTRYRMLKEMNRVTKKWLIIDYNYPNIYSLKYVLRKVDGLLGKRPNKRRMTLQEVSRELMENGFCIDKAIPVSRLLSENVLLLCSK